MPKPGAAPPAGPEFAGQFSGPSRWWALAGVGLGVLMATIDVSIVNISLPTLVEQLHTDFPTVQWVVLGYALVITSLMLAAARLGDMLGAKKPYLIGLGLFSLGSLLCGVAPSAGWLIAFRAFQGLGASLMQALGMAIITTIFPASQRGRALGVVGGIVATGLALGPPLGGLLIGFFGWRSVFLVNLPLGLLAWYLVVRCVPLAPPSQSGQHFDLAGACTLMASLVSYALGMTWGQLHGFDSLPSLGLLAFAGLCLAVFVAVELKLAQPMVDLTLFKDPLFSLNLLMGFLSFVQLGGVFVIPFFLELVQGYSTEQAGMLMMTVPVCMGLVSPWAGWLSDRYGSRGISLLGLLLLALGSYQVSTLEPGVSLLGYILRIMPVGLGMGLFQSPNNSAIMGRVPPHRVGVASGLLSLARTLGNTSGLPLMGAVFSHAVLAEAHLPARAAITQAPPEALAAGLRGAYRLATMLALAAAGLALWAWFLDRPRAGVGNNGSI
ncbi:MAG: MFS transporter [Pseudomonadota bacterium]